MYKVLIVEDDPMVSMINEQYVLKNKKFTVLESLRNGQDALDFLSENKVDLVILDVFMPYMDGLETLKKIRDLKINTEVIMVTAANDSETLESTMHLGVLDFLIKPFAYERFQIALEKFIAKHDALKDRKIIDQNCIDSIISQSVNTNLENLTKGIQEKTLTSIKKYFEERKGWVTGDIVAEKLGLSIVTIRHYLAFLKEAGIIEESINYETGGRPSAIYKSRQ